MRTEASGGRRVAYVANVPSDIHVKIPADEIGAKGFGRHIYVYAIDRSTIGISPCCGRVKSVPVAANCEYEKQDGFIIAKLPQRMAQWYKIDNLAESDYWLLTEPEKIRVRADLTPLIHRQRSAAQPQPKGREI
jgi:hypothetical protein